jgi:lipid-A-disaccharide synthase-like uncharacterized protein
MILDPIAAGILGALGTLGPAWSWEALGWLGQACFFSRFLVQWGASERAGRPVAPAIFWWLSSLGSLLMVGYTLRLGEAGSVLLPGYVANLALYVRNLWMMRRGQGVRGLSPLPALGLAAVAVVALYASGAFDLRGGRDVATAWLVVGGVGQVLWVGRFLVQWYASEQRGESHFPLAFWWISLVGNGLLLAYAIHLGDRVLIAGYSVGPLVQIRNLMLHHRSRTRAAGPAS